MEVTNNKRINFYILSIIGLSMILIYLWARIIRERLPRDLPFDMTLLNLSILIMTCLIFVMIIKNLIKPNIYKSTLYLNIMLLLQKIQKPLQAFDTLFRNISLIVKIINKGATLCRLIFLNKSNNRKIAYYGFFIFPKIIVLFVFLIDIFIFYKFYYFYKIIILNFIPLITSYFIYSMRKHLEMYLELLETYYEVDIISTKANPDHEIIELTYPDGDFNYKITTFLWMQQTSNYSEVKYKCSIRWNVVNKYYPTQDLCIRDINNFTEDQHLIMEKDFYELMPIARDMYNFLEYFDFFLKRLSIIKFTKIINIIIYSLYLICWVYILFISLPYLHLMPWEAQMLQNFKDIFDPFSDAPLESSMLIVCLTTLKMRKPLYISAYSKIKIFRRTMLNSRCIHAARAAFHCLYALSNQDVMNQTTKKDIRLMANNLALLSVDSSKGIPQHKETIITAMITQKFSSEDFYEPLKPLIPKLLYEPNTFIDARIVKEIQVIAVYVKKFDKSIDWILATCDSRASSFPYQKQPNQDWWVNLKTNSTTFLDRALGLGYKVVAHDEKAGKNMFNHTTRGTLGLLTYDTDNNNVQIMSDPISYENLINHIENCMSGISEGLKNDNKNPNVYDKTFKEIRQLFKRVDETDFYQVRGAYEKAQELLWTNIQCDPTYNRSVSFIFMDHLEKQPLNPQEELFRNRFISLLPNRLYNLDKKGDKTQVFRAMLIAYRDTIDPKIILKFQYLKNNIGLDLTNSFSEMINILMQK